MPRPASFIGGALTAIGIFGIIVDIIQLTDNYWWLLFYLGIGLLGGLATGSVTATHKTEEQNAYLATSGFMVASLIFLTVFLIIWEKDFYAINAVIDGLLVIIIAALSSFLTFIGTLMMSIPEHGRRNKADVQPASFIGSFFTAGGLFTISLITVRYTDGYWWFLFFIAIGIIGGFSAGSVSAVFREEQKNAYLTFTGFMLAALILLTLFLAIWANDDPLTVVFDSKSVPVLIAGGSGLAIFIGTAMMTIRKGRRY